MTNHQFAQLLDAIRSLDRGDGGVVITLLIGLAGTVLGALLSALGGWIAARRADKKAEIRSVAQHRRAVKKDLVAWSLDVAHGSPRRKEAGGETGERINDLRVALAMTGAASDAVIGNDIDRLLRNWLERSEAQGPPDRYGKPRDVWTDADRVQVDGLRRELVSVLDRWIAGVAEPKAVADDLAAIADKLADGLVNDPSETNGPDDVRAES